MEEVYWLLTHGSRVLHEFRKNIRGMWQDEAARELTSRYLDPHEDEDSQILAGLNQQKDLLDKSRSKLGSAATFGRQAEEHSLTVFENIEASEKEISSAYIFFNEFGNYDAEVHSKLPDIQRLISQANNACDRHLGTIHPIGNEFENLSNPETQPQSISLSQERNKPTPPEGWSGGGLERGG